MDDSCRQEEDEEAQTMRRMLQSLCPFGFSEPMISHFLPHILKEIVKYHHGDGEKHKRVHGNVNLGLILVDNMRKPSDITLIDEDDERSSSVDCPGETYKLWKGKNAAPTANHSSNPKIDSWGFGLCALELYYGLLPTKNREEFIKMVTAIRNWPRTLPSMEELTSVLDDNDKGAQRKAQKKGQGKKKAQGKAEASAEFAEMVKRCLHPNESERPSIEDVQADPFFKKFPEFVEEYGGGGLFGNGDM